MNLLPQSRCSEIVVQSLGKEMLVYDLIRNQAYQLNETSTIVFQACDGKRSFEDLKRAYKFTDDLIYLALDMLAKHKLLAPDYVSPFTGLNRREVIRKAGLSTMIALPIVASLIAPTAAQAVSSCQPLGSPCTQNNGTQSNCCDSSARCTNTGTVACRPCLPSGDNTNCSGAGCCTGNVAFFSNSCCKGVTETSLGNNVFSCSCN